MSATNSTSNYELSQFIGTDKPAWLSDYNGDMAKIDAGIHTAQTTATASDGKADANTTKIGDLSYLSTTAKTNLVSAVNEVDGKAETAKNTASQIGTIANNAKEEADGLTRYLSITQTAKINPSVSGATIGNINDVYYALNADGTLGKIYGRIRITATTTGTITLTLPVSALSVTSQFSITGACYYNTVGDGNYTVINARDMVINTNGNCTITWSGFNVGETITVWLPPCLYFFTDFGDVVNPNN